MNLNGKVALVTGGSRGIGSSIAKSLALSGASVAINYKSSDDEAQKTLEAIKNSGGYAALVKGDISSYSEAERVVNSTIESFGRIDILVNNAGISKRGLFIDMQEEEWDEIIGTNLKGVYNCTHNALKYMLSKKKGSIINISSIWGNAGASCEVAYSVSKGGINSFTKALAKELAPSNIRVNCIAPGVIDTEMNQWLSEEEKNDLIQSIPMMAMGKGEDIGALAVFLAGEASRYITGQIITVDGGMI